MIGHQIHKEPAQWKYTTQPRYTTVTCIRLHASSPFISNRLNLEREEVHIVGIWI